MANLWARRKSASPSAVTAGPKMRSFSCRTASMLISPRESAPAARRADASGLELFSAYRNKFPELAAEIELMQRRELPQGWDRNLPVFPADPKGIGGPRSLRQSAECPGAKHPLAHRRLGGSRAFEQDHADLRGRVTSRPTIQAAGTCTSESASTRWPPSSMGCRCRSCAALAPASLSSADYARPAIRLSALMELPTLFIFSHDAMGDGEDGPTHQPVEHLASLRAIPGLVTLRPGDANEVVEAYRYIMQLRHKPAVLALSRQPLPTLGSKQVRAGIGRGTRRLCSGRRAGRQTRGHSDRFRQ